MKSIPLNFSSKVVLFLFIILVGWWLFIFANGLQNTNHNYYYGALEGVLPVIGALFGFANSKKWGWFGSSMGRSVFFLSSGLLTWGIGTIVFAYYNIFLQVAVPYPSVADGFYIISWVLWAISMINLSRATGMKFRLRNLLGKLMLFIIPIVAIVFSYYALIVVARQGAIGFSGDALTTFFNLAYPIGDIVILTIALLIYGLSFNYLGGFFKWPIFIILGGFVINYIGDFFFVYLTTKGTYFVADWVDLVYTIAFFSLSLGVCLMDPANYSANNKS